MKRLTAFILSVFIAFSFASCSKEKAEMYCFNCGEGMAKSDLFCSACGMSAVSISENNSSTEAETTTAPETTTVTETTTAPETTTKLETTTKTTTKHTHSYSKKVTNPTCTKKGYTTYTCKCGDSYTDDYVNAKHNYSKYICTNCNAIDKEHAYEYLVEWLKEHGTQRGNEIYFSFVGGDGAHEIVYDKTYNYMYVRIIQSDSSMLLDLSDPNKKFKYIFKYRDYSATGIVNAKTFTSETVLSCDEYSGYSGDKDKILKLASLKIEIAIILLDMLDSVYNAGITYQDLGFEIYVKD